MFNCTKAVSVGKNEIITDEHALNEQKVQNGLKSKFLPFFHISLN